MSINNADRDRLIHINFVMNQIHEHSNAIYEHLVDKEYEQVSLEIHILKEGLNTLSQSISNNGTK